jgi:hypothetical protein
LIDQLDIDIDVIISKVLADAVICCGKLIVYVAATMTTLYFTSLSRSQLSEKGPKIRCFWRLSVEVVRAFVNKGVPDGLVAAVIMGDWFLFLRFFMRWSDVLKR